MDASDHLIKQPNQTTLKGFRDWWTGLVVIKSTILDKPMLFIILVCLIVIEEMSAKSNHKVPLVGLIELFVMVQMSYPIMRSVLIDLNLENANLPVMIDKSTSGRLVGITFLYNLVFFLLSLLLLLPGIWWATRSSLAAVFACLEQKNPIDCLKASHKLVSSNFWLTFKYLTVLPTIIILGLFLLNLFIDWLCNRTFPQLFADITAASSPIEVAIASIPDVLWSVIVYLWLLSIFPLMVRLYHFLQEEAKRKLVF